MDPRLAELLTLWDRKQSRGESVAADDLCATCPELLPAFRRVLAERSAAPDSQATMPPASADPLATLPPHLANAAETATLPPSNSSTAIPIAAVQVPGYDILAELGRGGMGVVYKARQHRPNRPVALKMVIAGVHATAADVARFLLEAEAIARLQHVNIVQLYEVGQCDGRPYFSLEFCDGGTLANRLAGTPLKPREAARMLHTLAQAVQVAHDAGIVHRDLKPHNVLLDFHASHSDTHLDTAGLELAQAVAKITDFGLAKQTGGSELTAAGSIMGTPSYMAPEQADPRHGEVGPAADVYALGAILYECLTGRPPFRASTPLDTIMQVMNDDVVPPSQLNPQTPHDLEIVTLKCLQKDAKKRYASASALALDLHHFLQDEPISARSTGRMERFGRWCRKSPWRAAALFGLAAFVGLSVGLLISMVRSSERHAGALALALEKSQTSEDAAKANERKALDAQHELTTTLALRNITVAHQDWRAGNVVRARELLHSCPEELRGWDWHHVNRLTHAELMTGQDSSARVMGLAYALGGTALVASGSDGKVRIWDPAQGAVTRTLTAHLKPLPFGDNQLEWYNVAVSPDGKRIAAGGGRRNGIVVWDAATGDVLQILTGHADLVRGVAFSPDGKRLASTSRDNTLRLWDLAKGAAEKTWTAPDHLNSVAFSTDGKKIASTGTFARLWDIETGTAIVLTGHRSPTLGVAFSPDGRLLATAGGTDGVVRIWNARTGQHVLALPGHPLFVVDVAFSPDGRRLASCGWKAELRLWDTNNWRELPSPRNFTVTLTSLAFSPDAQELAAGDWYGHLKTYPAIDSAECQVIRDENNSALTALAVTPDGKRFVAARGNLIRIWDRGEGWTPEKLEQPGQADCLAISPDGAWLASASQNNQAVLWDLAKPSQQRILNHGGPVRSVAFRSDGQQLATASDDNSVRLWDVASAKELHRLDHASRVNSLAYTRDGQQLVSTSSDGQVRLWDAGNGKLIQVIVRLPGGAGAVALSRDHRLCAVADNNNVIHVVDLGSNKMPTLTRLIGHSWGIRRLVFSPDNLRLASAGGDGTVRIWHPTEGRETITLAGHSEPVNDLAFSADGQRLISVGGDGAIRVWHAERSSGPSERRAAYLAANLIRHQQERRQAFLTRHSFADAFHADYWIAVHPKEGNSLADRALARAQLGRYQEALADLQLARELSPADLKLHLKATLVQALLQAVTGDEKGFRDLVGAALLATTFTSDAEAQLLVAGCATLLPNAANAKQLVARIESGKKKSREPYMSTTWYAAALYRAGRFPEAQKWFETACTEHASGGLPWDWYYLALVHHRQGRKEEARAWLRKANEWLENATTDTPLSISMFDREPDAPVGIMWIVFRIIRKEAEREIGDVKAP